MTRARMTGALAVAAALSSLGCSDKATAPPPLLGAPSSPEYVALQATDVPPNLVRCGYTGPMADYLEGIKRLSEKAYGSISSTWAALQGVGATAAYVAVYSETAEACDVWVTGGEGGPVRGGSRVVSTVVVQFPDLAVAEAAYRADIFKQSALQEQTGLRVLVGSATGLSPNAVIGANEEANPSVHQAVWQKGPFNVFFTSRNLTRPEFTSASNLTSRRIP